MMRIIAGNPDNKEAPMHEKPTVSMGKAALARGAGGLRFVRFVFERFLADQCPQRAAALTYTTLLALVPLLAISFAVFAAFPAFAGVREELQTFVFENFVPQVGDVVLANLGEFAGKAGSLSMVGVIFLFVTSVALLSAINNTFDGIWRVRGRRSVIARLPVYWLVLTLTPLLMAASLLLSGYLFTIARETGVEAYTGPLTRVAGMAPLVLQIAGLTTLFLLVPFFPVRRRDAILGGITAGLLMEALKKGFGLYITSFPTYQTIYGALATVPIFLLWMYVVWTVVLFGAEVTAALPEWKAGVKQASAGARRPAQRLTAAVAVLAALLAASQKGGGLRRRRLMNAVRHDPESVAEATERLGRANYIARSERGDWLLVRDLAAVTLAELYADLDLTLSAVSPAAAKTTWARRYAEIIARADKANHDLMDLPLKTLLATPEEEFGEVMGRDSEPAEESRADNRKTRLLALLGLAWLVTR